MNYCAACQPFRNDFITSIKKKGEGKETTFQQTWNFLPSFLSLSLSRSLRPSKLIVDHVDKFRALGKGMGTTARRGDTATGVEG